MKPISICRTTLNYKTNQRYISSQQFRGAFIDYIRTHFTQKQQEKLPMHLAFNKDKNGKQLTRYSQIQYKIDTNQLEIIAIGKSEKIVDLWLKKVLKNNDFSINGKVLSITKPEKNNHFWYPELQEPKLYKIQNWCPFNSQSVGDETQFDKIIWGNMHRMLSDLNIKFSQKVTISILEKKKRKQPYKGYDVAWISYDILFSTNINLPQHLGIGHIVSLGAGKITKVKQIL